MSKVTDCCIRGGYNVGTWNNDVSGHSPDWWGSESKESVNFVICVVFSEGVSAVSNNRV